MGKKEVLPYCADLKGGIDDRPCKVDVVVLEYQGLVDEVKAFRKPQDSDKFAAGLRKEHADLIEREDATVHELVVRLE